MVKMRSARQLAVIDYLKSNQGTSVRRVQRVMGWGSKEAHNIVGRLVKLGIVKKVKHKSPTALYLSAGWKAKIAAKPPAKPPAKAAAVSNPVAQECRSNWHGYNIHKIFGSAKTQ